MPTTPKTSSRRPDTVKESTMRKGKGKAKNISESPDSDTHTRHVASSTPASKDKGKGKAKALPENPTPPPATPSPSTSLFNINWPQPNYLFSTPDTPQSNSSPFQPLSSTLSALPFYTTNGQTHSPDAPVPLYQVSRSGTASSSPGFPSTSASSGHSGFTASNSTPSSHLTMADLAHLLPNANTNDHSAPPARRVGPFVLCPNLPEICEVDDPALYDVLLQDTYQNLCHLRRGIFSSWSNRVGRGQVNYSSWVTHCPNMSSVASRNFIVFQEHGRWINPSRVTPFAVTLRDVSNNDIPRYNVYRDSCPAIALSCGYLWESFITGPKSYGLSQKMISIILHKLEWERLVAWCCMVFNVPKIAAQVNMSALQFATRADWNPNAPPDGAPETAPTSHDEDDEMFSHTQSVALDTASSSHNNEAMTVSANSTIPVYDIRGIHFVPERDLPNLSSFPRWHGEIPRGSFVVVGYTLAAYCPNRKWNLATNLQFALVVGTPSH